MSQRRGGIRVAVVVPARNEAERVTRCLTSVRRSLTRAVAKGEIEDYAVAVVAHKCLDATAMLAARSLVGVPHCVLRDERSDTVGAVRSLGVRVAAAALAGGGRPAELDRTWVLSTDADSVVPLTWVGDLLDRARGGAVAVVGMTSLTDERRLSSAARVAYRALIEAGLHGTGHDHVFGANLAVRLDAYLAVGGFPHVAVGEDQALVDALAARGLPIVRPADVVVRTSGRRHGRAVGGVADLLARLDHERSRAPTVHGLAVNRRTAPPAPAPATS